MMFVVEPAPNRGHSGHEKYVVDHDRNAWLQVIAGLGSEPGFMFQFVIAGQAIPLTTRYRVVSDAEPAYTLMTVLSFGPDSTAELLAGISTPRFESKDQSKALLLIAIEALLVFGTGYNGHLRAPGSFRVETTVDGVTKTYTRNDFS